MYWYPSSRLTRNNEVSKKCLAFNDNKKTSVKNTLSRVDENKIY